MRWRAFIRMSEGQRCWAHKLRNVSNYLKRRDQDKCIKEARAIYSDENRKEAVKIYNEWVKKWRTAYPKAIKCIEKDLEELLNFYCCPQEIRVKVRTTNVIERAFREVRRRTTPIILLFHYSVQSIVLDYIKPAISA